MRISELEKVEVSLTRGKLMSKKTKTLLWVFEIISLIPSFINMLTFRDLPNNKIKLIVMFIVWIFIALLISVMVILTKNDTLSRDMKTWLKDAIEVEAMITKLDVGNNKFRLEVAFELNGVVHKQQSKPYRKNSVFAKHEDRQEIIYYSPAFDQVILLKQQ